MSNIKTNQAAYAARREAVFLASLVLLAVLAYVPVLTHEFVNFDDNVYVTENPHVQAGLSWAGLGWAFRSIEAGYWHPLTWLSHMADCQLFGLHAWGHHLTSLLLHLVNTVLLFMVLKQMTGARGRSAMVAALFALHPLHVESVAWVAERKDLLSAFFFFLTLWTYARYAAIQFSQPSIQSQQPISRFTFHVSSYYLLSILCFALGLMSKPMLVTLPLVLCLLDYWPLKRVRNAECGMRREGQQRPQPRTPSILSLLAEKVPFLALAGACSLLTYWGPKQIGALALEAGPTLGTRIANAVISYATYLGKTVWPYHLAIYYPYPESIPSFQVAAALLLLAGITAFCFRWRRQRPYLLVGWAWYLVMLLPVVGLIQVGSHAMADRYTYLPLIGIFMAAVWGLAEALQPRLQERLLLAGATVVLTACAVVTFAQLRYWRNSETLFRHALAVTTGSGKAHNALGVALLEEGNPAAAAVEFREGVRLNPQFMEVRDNLGLALLMQGKAGEATAVFQEVLRFRPDDATAHNNLGKTLAEQGKLAEAGAHFAAAIRLKPAYGDAHYNLGNVLATQGRPIEASACYLAAIRLNPTRADAHIQLGTLLLLQGNADEAADHFTLALKAAPADAAARLERALALADSAGQTNASAHLRQRLNLLRLGQFLRPTN